VTFHLDANLLITVYAFLHVAYGLVTHYHSVAQVRHWNQEHDAFTRFRGGRISNWKMLICFCGRMIWGLPIFVISRIVSPIGNRWHMTSEEISNI